MKAWFSGLRLKILMLILIPFVGINVLFFTNYYFTNKTKTSLSGIADGDMPSIRGLETLRNSQVTAQLYVARAIADFEKKGAVTRADYVNRARDAIKEMDKGYAQYYALPMDEPEKILATKMTEGLDQWKGTVEKVLKDVEDNKIDEALGLYNSELAAKRKVVAEEIQKLIDDNYNDAEKDKVEAFANMKSTLQWTLVVGLIITFGCLGYGIFTAKNLVGFIFSKIEELDHSAQSTQQIGVQLSQNSRKVTEAAQEQAAAIQESVSALSEMSSMITQTGENVRLTQDSAQEVTNKAVEGQHVVQKLSESMQSIQRANEQLQEISDVIMNIHEKTNVINDIVFKTQLLSFNASIEAARAGQHGRGFAVVAEEVGNLAEMSGKASKDIEVLLTDSQKKVKETLESIQSRVNDGNAVSKQVYVTFNEITQKISNINMQVKSINEATEQQRVGIQQSNVAMKQLDSSAHVNNESAHETFRSAEDLNVENTKLFNVLQEFRQLVSGNKAAKKFEERPTRILREAPKTKNYASNDDELEYIAQEIIAKKDVFKKVS